METSFQPSRLLVWMIFRIVRNHLALKAERDAKFERLRIEGQKNLAALEEEQDAFRANFETLKAERKAREEQASQQSASA